MQLSTNVIPLQKAYLCEDCQNLSQPSRVSGVMRCGACGSAAIEPISLWVKAIPESFHVWVRPGAGLSKVSHAQAL